MCFRWGWSVTVRSGVCECGGVGSEQRSTPQLAARGQPPHPSHHPRLRSNNHSRYGAGRDPRTGEDGRQGVPGGLCTATAAGPPARQTGWLGRAAPLHATCTPRRHYPPKPQISRRLRAAAVYNEAINEVREATRAVHRDLAHQNTKYRGYKPLAAHQVVLECPDPARPKYGVARIKVGRGVGGWVGLPLLVGVSRLPDYVTGLPSNPLAQPHPYISTTARCGPGRPPPGATAPC